MIPLGPIFGLTAASALMIDYTLTVAVSISSGVQQVISAIPGVSDFRVELALVFLAMFACRGNLLHDGSKKLSARILKDEQGHDLRDLH